MTQETLFSNECGDVVYFRQLDLYGYYHRDKNDGKTDDCTYYFKFRDHEVILYTFYCGDHTAEYQQYILNCLYQCICTYAFERI